MLAFSTNTASAIPFNNGEMLVSLLMDVLSFFRAFLSWDSICFFFFLRVAGTWAQMAFPGSPLHCVQAAKSLLNYVLGRCLWLFRRQAPRAWLCPSLKSSPQGAGQKKKTEASQQMFLAGLFIVAKTWKQPKCPLMVTSYTNNGPPNHGTINSNRKD